MPVDLPACLDHIPYLRSGRALIHHAPPTQLLLLRAKRDHCQGYPALCSAVPATRPKPQPRCFALFDYLNRTKIKYNLYLILRWVCNARCVRCMSNGVLLGHLQFVCRVCWIAGRAFRKTFAGYPAEAPRTVHLRAWGGVFFEALGGFNWQYDADAAATARQARAVPGIPARERDLRHGTRSCCSQTTGC